MDGLIFVIIWLGGASIHTMIEMQLKKQTIFAVSAAIRRRRQKVNIDKGAQGYE